MVEGRRVLRSCNLETLSLRICKSSGQQQTIRSTSISEDALREDASPCFSFPYIYLIKLARDTRTVDLSLDPMYYTLKTELHIVRSEALMQGLLNLPPTRISKRLFPLFDKGVCLMAGLEPLIESIADTVDHYPCLTTGGLIFKKAI